MKTSTRYGVVIVGQTVHLVSQNGIKILKVLFNDGPISYNQLQKKTKIPLGSLYVFTGRLKAAKMLKVVPANEYHDALVISQLAKSDTQFTPSPKYVG